MAWGSIFWIITSRCGAAFLRPGRTLVGWIRRCPPGYTLLRLLTVLAMAGLEKLLAVRHWRQMRGPAASEAWRTGRACPAAGVAVPGGGDAAARGPAALL